MQPIRPTFVRLAAIIASCGILSTQAALAETRATKVVVPLPPGGPVDFVARTVTEEISRVYDLTISIENRPGAAGQVGGEFVAHAPGDGHTLLVAGSGLFVVIPHVRKLNYDPLKSLQPICELVSYPNVIAVNATSPYRTLEDLIGTARAEPGALTIASIGPGTATEVAFEMLKQAAKVNMTFVPFPGSAAAANALLGGHVTAVLLDYSLIAEHHKAGSLRALAVGSAKRMPPLLGVPSVAESGFPGYTAEIWIGLFAPALTPSAIVSQIAERFGHALDNSKTRSRLLELGLVPSGTCGADFSAFIHRQYEEYGAVISEAKIKAE